METIRPEPGALDLNAVADRAAENLSRRLHDLADSLTG